MLKEKLPDDDDDKVGRVKALRRKYMAANDDYLYVMDELDASFTANVQLPSVLPRVHHTKIHQNQSSSHTNLPLPVNDIELLASYDSSEGVSDKLKLI